MDPIDEIAQAVLYEGHILWPYRRSAAKNRQRWTFGGVYPRAWSEGGHPDDPWRMRTQCLLEAGPDARVEVRIRFLQIVERQVARLDRDEGGDEDDGRLTFVDRLDVEGERHLTWTEAMEREVVASGLPLGTLADHGHRQPIDIAAGRDREWLTDDADGRVGALLRSWRPLRGTLSLRADRLREGHVRLTVDVENATPWRGTERDDAQKQSFASLHAVLRVDDGEFVSLMDPPDELADAAEACENRGWWPVLVDAEDERDAMLASPIVLYDHPKIAPESPGDLFDSSEIDQLLILNVLTMTDEEKAEMRASDPRAREILDRCSDLSPEELLRLHGATRSLRPVPR